MATEMKTLTINNTTFDIVDAKARESVGLSNIVGTTIGNKCAEFSAKLNNTDKAESFVFFTDPHLLDGNFNEGQMHEYLQTVKKYYNMTPTSFVMCGGDWIGNSDTPEGACFKLGYLDGYCRSLFNPYYAVVGNHDLNYQGKLDADSAVGTGILTNETIRNLMLRGEENLYYAFDGAYTRFYVLDTGSDWVSTMTDYRWEQIAWLADKLATEDKEFSAIAMHITYVSNSNGYGLALFASNVISLLSAYNNRTSITLNGVQYNFADCIGNIKFVISGHTHEDIVETVNDIPIITTTQLKDSGTPSFDLCVVDYNNDVMNLVRIGAGENREIALSNKNDNDIVLLLAMNLSGVNFVDNVKNRAVYAQQTNPLGLAEIGWVGTSDYPYDKPYYPIIVPEEATKIVVTCPSTVKWAFHYWKQTNTSYGNMVDTGWLPAGGGEFDVPENMLCFEILFHDNNNTDMSVEGYDASAYSISFEFAEGEDEEEQTTVLLPTIGWSNNTILSFPSRMVAISTVPTTEGSLAFTNGNGVTTTYYPLAIPSGVTKLVVNAPDNIYSAIQCLYNASGVVRSNGDSGWIGTGNIEYNLGNFVNNPWYILVFKQNPDTTFASDFDTSSISWHFE